MKANRFASNDEGVSAVIGVILMVAITVILAAVIAAFVFGMVGGVGNKVSPAFTSKRVDATTVQVTLQDKNGATSITKFVTTLPENNVDMTYKGSTYDPANDAANALLDIGVGDTITLKSTIPAPANMGNGISNAGGPVHIVATANVNSNPQIVMDTTV